jgi:hypothetical protein
LAEAERSGSIGQLLAQARFFLRRRQRMGDLDGLLKSADRLSSTA